MSIVVSFFVTPFLLAGNVTSDSSSHILKLPICKCHSFIFLRHCLGRQELDLGIGIVGLHQTGGVHLDPLQVDALGANGLQNCRNIQKYSEMLSR